MRSSQARWDALEYTGAVPQVLTSQATLALSSASAQTANNIGAVANESYLEELIVNIHTALSASGIAFTLDLGDETDDDEYVDGYSFTATTAGRFVVDLTATTIITRQIPAGRFLKYSLPVSTSTVGVISVVAILVPRTAS